MNLATPETVALSRFWMRISCADYPDNYFNNHVSGLSIRGRVAAFFASCVRGYQLPGADNEKI